MAELPGDSEKRWYQLSQLGCSKELGASATKVVIENGDNEEEDLWELPDSRGPRGTVE